MTKHLKFYQEVRNIWQAWYVARLSVVFISSQVSAGLLSVDVYFIRRFLPNLQKYRRRKLQQDICIAPLQGGKCAAGPADGCVTAAQSLVESGGCDWTAFPCSSATVLLASVIIFQHFFFSYIGDQTLCDVWGDYIVTLRVSLFLFYT